MEPTQAAPAGFVLGGGAVGAGRAGKGTGPFNMQGRTARMPEPGSPVIVGLLPLLGPLGGKPGEEKQQPWEPRWLPIWAL